MASPIVISDDEDDGGSCNNSSAFFFDTFTENGQSPFGSLGSQFSYKPPQVKTEPEETPMEAVKQHTPDTGTETQGESRRSAEGEPPAEPTDQPMLDIEARDQGEPGPSQDEDTPMEPVDQAMPEAGGECQPEPQVPLEDEPSLFFQDCEDGNDEGFDGLPPSAPTPRDIQRPERFSKEPTSPQAGAHPVDFGHKISSTGQFKLTGDVSDDEDDEIPDASENNNDQDANEFPDIADFGNKISSTGKFKLTGDVSDDEDDEIPDASENNNDQDANELPGTEGDGTSSTGQFILTGDISNDKDDEIADAPEINNDQDANELPDTEGDENDEEYEEHFGDDFDQGNDDEEQGGDGEEENQDEEQLDAEDVDVDGDQAEEEYSGQEEPSSDTGSQYEGETESEWDPEVENPSKKKSAASAAKGPSDGKPRAKKKDPRTAKFPQTAREYFRRLKNKQARERDTNTAPPKRKGDPKKAPPAKRRKSANQTGWRDNETCMKLAKKFLETEDLTNAANEGALPSMGSIKARTQASQFAQIVAKIPKGGDTRRLASQKKDLRLAVRSFGYKRMEALDGTWRHKDMETGIFNYQVTVASWMMERETSGSSPYGGLIGDEMGMGKTLVSLACAVGHPPEREDKEEYCSATLVIVPNKMIARQWVEEIRKHCKEHIRNATSIYQFGESWGLDFYKEKFFVVATYREVMHQHPGIVRVQELKELHEGDEYTYNRELSKAAGELFKINWYRIILDEAHQIKNVKGHTSIACCDLSSKFSWCLSGTPLSNTPQEFFPYLKFLGCEFTDTSANFYAKFVDGKIAKDNFDSLVGLVMYRRTKKDSFLKHKILDLPDMHSQEIWVPPAREEQAIYETVHNHYENAIRRIKKQEENRGHLTDGEKDELSKIRLAQYTRLRQTVSHIFGTEPFFRESIRIEELDMLMEDLDPKRGRTKVLDHLEQHQDGATAYSAGLKKLGEQKSNVFGGIFELKNYLKVCRSEVKLRKKKSRCLICNTEGMPKDPMISRSCGHIYCLKCLGGVLGARGDTPTMCLHPGCEEPLLMGKEVDIFDTYITGAKEDKEYKEPGEDANGVRIATKAEANGFYTAAFHRRKHFMMPPSTKLTAALAMILTWQEDHPDDKILVFTQFVMSGKILGYMLGQVGIQFVYLYGSVSDRSRKKAIDAFKEDPQKKIMIIGLKCGSQALNLTAANRVILIDPWWNNVQENQAFGRVWRHGQEKETHLVHIWSDTPMDRHIFDLQHDKALQVDYALQDDGHKPAVLDDATLAKLFAPVERERPKGTKRKSQADSPAPKMAAASSTESLVPLENAPNTSEQKTKLGS